LRTVSDVREAPPTRVQASCESGLCTSVDWSHAAVCPGVLLATATSDCELVVFDAASPGGLTPLVSLPAAHDLEIWAVAFDWCAAPAHCVSSALLYPPRSHAPSLDDGGLGRARWCVSVVEGGQSRLRR
jgi:hypothetical protein